MRQLLCGALFTLPLLAWAGEAYDGRIVHVQPPDDVAKTYDAWIGKLPAQLKYRWGVPTDEYVVGGHSYLRYSLPRGIDCHTVFQVAGEAPRVITAWRQYGTACPTR